MPPTPTWAESSYGPMRVPGAKDMAVGWNRQDYMRLVSIRRIGRENAVVLTEPAPLFPSEPLCPDGPRHFPSSPRFYGQADAPWADLPNRYPSYQTCHRRFRQPPSRVGA